MSLFCINISIYIRRIGIRTWAKFLVTLERDIDNTILPKYIENRFKSVKIHQANVATLRQEYNNEKARLEKIRVLGYDYVICTVKSDNIPQLKILNKNGWKLLDDFINNETGNTVYIYGKKM